MTLDTASANAPARSASFCRKKEKDSKNNKHPPLVVQHNYHDHAKDPIYDSSEQENLNLGGVATPFPVRLFEMLSTLDDEDSDVVSWQPHGRCFVVRKPIEFTRMLPQFFKLSKIASFQRQLNLYGFVRLTSGLDKCGYYHEQFLRGRPDLLWTIPRAKVKGTKVRAKSNPAAEPNFWNMDWVGVSKSNEHKRERLMDHTPSTTLKSALRATVAAAAAASVPDDVMSSAMPYQQHQEQLLQEKTRCQSISVVSESGDEMDHSMSDDEAEHVDFFDRLLDDMFENEQSYDFDALQRRLIPDH